MGVAISEPYAPESELGEVCSEPIAMRLTTHDTTPVLLRLHLPPETWIIAKTMNYCSCYCTWREDDSVDKNRKRKSTVCAD